MSFGTKTNFSSIGTQPPSIPSSSTQTSALAASVSNISRLRLSLAQFTAPIGPPPSASSKDVPLLPGYKPGSGLPGSGSFDTTGGLGTRSSAGEPAGPAEVDEVRAQLDAQVQDATTPTGTPGAPLVEAGDPLLALTDTPTATVTQVSAPPRRIPWAKIGIGLGMVIGVWVLLRRR